MAWVKEHWRWVESYEGAAHPWDVPTVRGMVGGLAVTLLVLLVWFRVRRTISLRRPETDPFGPLRYWTRQFYFMVSFSDALAFFGLIYFFVSGRLWALFVGGAPEAPARMGTKWRQVGTGYEIRGRAHAGD